MAPTFDAAGRDARGSQPTPTLATMLSQATDVFRDAGLEDPRAEARRVVATAADIPALDLVTAPDKPLPPAAASRIAEFIRRRAAREPLSRILGEREFYGRSFSISAATLDPRPDTETLIRVALTLAQTPPLQGKQLQLLDVGTGSGAILVTLLAELPRAPGAGRALIAEARAAAPAHAARHGVAERRLFTRHDVRDGLTGQHDLILSNPPYIPSGDIGGLAPEVRCHDPRVSLDGGADGLDFYRLLASNLARLSPGGWLAVEVGAGQSDAVAYLMATAAPGATIRTERDFSGHVRVVAVQPRGEVAVE